MYLSRLRVEVGPDPAREYPGQRWLHNLYHVHQRLCMAFPSADRRPEVTDGDQVHVRRRPEAGFLFRIDPGRDGRPVILVQSAFKPAWECAFYNARHFLVDPGPNRDPWELKAFDPAFDAGQRLRFRLLANPTRRLSKNSLGSDGKPMMREWSNKDGKGKRVPVPADKLHDWLTRRAETAGFSLEEKSLIIQPGYLYFDKGKHLECGGSTPLSESGSPRAEPGVPPLPHSTAGIGAGRRHMGRLRSVRYEGILEVTEPDKFRDTIIHGIGPGKAFGFGLLSVAPL